MHIIKLDSTFEFKTDEELRDYFENCPGRRKASSGWGRDDSQKEL